MFTTKEYKKVKMILRSLHDVYGVKPGTLLTITKNKFSWTRISGKAVDAVINSSVGPYFIDIAAESNVLFLDVVYVPDLKRHFIRFLYKEQIVGIPFDKGFTIRHLMKNSRINTILGQ